jgi:pimeloyl-ACP methyl ester carboxylesterase
MITPSARTVRLAFSASILSLPLALRAETPPTMMVLSTGSEVATWSMPADKPEHKTPVVFVHGGPGMYTTQGVMKKGATIRAAGFNTIYFDQAGGGKSKRLPAVSYSIERSVADLEALRIALKQDKMVLWGSSFGASLATVYATRFPDRVAGLILTSPGSYPGTNANRDYSITNRGKVKFSKALKDAVGKVDREGAKAEAGLSQDDAGRAFDELVNADMMGGMVCKGSDVVAPPPGVGGNLFANRLIQKDLDKISFKPTVTARIPTLIVRGACDFQPASNAQAFATLFGTSVTTIPNAGHGMLESRDEIESALTRFVKETLRGVE